MWTQKVSSPDRKLCTGKDALPLTMIVTDVYVHIYEWCIVSLIDDIANIFTIANELHSL